MICEDCGCNENENNSIMDYSHEEDCKNWYLCDECVSARQDAKDELDTQRCLNNWVITGFYR